MSSEVKIDVIRDIDGDLVYLVYADYFKTKYLIVTDKVTKKNGSKDRIDYLHEIVTEKSDKEVVLLEADMVQDFYNLSLHAQAETICRLAQMEDYKVSIYSKSLRM